MCPDMASIKGLDSCGLYSYVFIVGPNKRDYSRRNPFVVIPGGTEPLGRRFEAFSNRTYFPYTTIRQIVRQRPD